jgi:hypothetical protein
MLRVDAAVIDCGDGDHYDTVMNFCIPRLSHPMQPVEHLLFRGSASLRLPSHILDPRTGLAQHLQRVIGLLKIRVVAHRLVAGCLGA